MKTQLVIDEVLCFNYVNNASMILIIGSFIKLIICEIFFTIFIIETLIEPAFHIKQVERKDEQMSVPLISWYAVF